ncbi:Hydrocephalus-inducing protein like protein [Platysternon megacephalum]|uniref:Serine/threonine-protein kinase mos n=1 Tax=Platysternon megacephalum TaxID=55544 RepID=A0A4D9ET20_9SAUR|nr:Hydrocephalus-inducing protein like protein [Platysternon megacephalum]
MPSPIPLNRPLPLEFSPSVDLRPCSSPLVLPGKGGKLFLGGTPSPRARRLPPRLAWCSIDWDQVCLLQPLGSGGFGSVYKATYHGETVAVKQVKKCSKNRLASRQSFWAELNVARLHHGNVVRVVAASTCAPASQDSLGTIIMEYAGRTTLHHVIYGTGCLQGKGEDDGGEQVTPKADVYSFAITLWQMVTREQPYLGERQYVLYAVVAYNLRPSLAAAVFSESASGQRLETVICRCWRSDAEERPSAELLLQSLHSLQDRL